ERAARAPVFHRGRGGAELHPGRGAPGHDPAAVVGGHRQARAQAWCDAARADQPPGHLDPGRRRALLEQGRIAVEGVVAAFERARRGGTRPGRLSVAVKPGSGTDLIKTIMQRCARDPRMPRVHILFGHPGGPAAAVRGGAADVAIPRTPFCQRGLDTELLLTEPRVAVLPSGHPLAARPELRRADLAGQPMPRWTGPDRPTRPPTPTGPAPIPPVRPGTRTTGTPAPCQAPKSTTSASYWTPSRSATPSP